MHTSEIWYYVRERSLNIPIVFSWNLYFLRWRWSQRNIQLSCVLLKSRRAGDLGSWRRWQVPGKSWVQDRSSNGLSLAIASTSLHLPLWIPHTPCNVNADLGVHYHIPSLLILLSSLVTGGVLRLCHSCGANLVLDRPSLAHWLSLRIIVVRCNTLGITLGIIFVITLRIILGIIVIANGALSLSTTLSPWFHCQSHHSSDARSLVLYDGGAVLAADCRCLPLFYAFHHFSLTVDHLHLLLYSGNGPVEALVRRWIVAC